MSLKIRLTDLATRIATECKSLRTLINGNSADLSALTTTAKNNIVAAINELDAEIASIAANAGAINDSASTDTSTWSSSKVATEIAALKDALTNGASAALDTLRELADAIGNDANFASTVTTALSQRVRFDAAQNLTAPQKTQACENIGIGNPEEDYVAVFTSALAT